MNRRAILIAAAALPAVSGCTPSLGLFNTLTPKDSGARQVVRGESYGDLPRQTLDVYAPKEAAGARLPIIMFIHGGSWRNGDRDEYGFVGLALAAQGFVVVIPNYRLVPNVIFPDFIEDCALALKWAHQYGPEHGGDADALVLMGHSAGAYNALMLALDARYARNAGIPSHALKGAIGLAGPYDFLPLDVDATRDAFGQAPDLASTQPVNFARADAPPLLLLWGEDDETVGPRNLANMEAAVRNAGGAVETKIYPGVDHIEILLALSRPLRGVAPVLEDVTAFARRVSA